MHALLIASLIFSGVLFLISLVVVLPDDGSGRTTRTRKITGCVLLLFAIVLVVTGGVGLARRDTRLCAEHGGHLVSLGRDTASCITPDGRIISPWK